MQAVKAYRGADGAMFDVPADEDEAFRREVPEAVPAVTYRGVDGALYDVPEGDDGAFRAEVPDAVPVRSVRTMDGALYDVPEGEGREFLAWYRTAPETERDRAATRAKVEGMSGPKESVAGAAVKGAVEGARSGLDDAGVSITKGLTSLPQLGAGLADIAIDVSPGVVLARALGLPLPKGGMVGRALERVAPLADTQEALQEQYSPDQQEVVRAVSKAGAGRGPLGKALAVAGQIARNPSFVPHAMLESLPSMAVGGAIGRVVSPLLAAAGMAPTAAAMTAGAIGEGVVGAGSAQEQIRAASPGGATTQRQTALAIGSGMLTGGISVLANRLAGSAVGRRLGLGAADIDTMLAGGGGGGSAGQRLLPRVFAGAVQEGLLEELPQSAQERIIQNLATGRPWGEGVPEAAVTGAAVGAVMGAGSNLARPAAAGSPGVVPQQARAGALTDQGSSPVVPNAGAEAAPVVPAAPMTPAVAPGAKAGPVLPPPKPGWITAPAVPTGVPGAPVGPVAVDADGVPVAPVGPVLPPVTGGRYEGMGVEQEAQARAGWPVAAGRRALIARRADGKHYTKPIEGQVVAIIDGQTVRVRYASPGERTATLQDISVDRLVEPPSRAGARKRAEALAALPADERKAVVQAERELKELLRNERVFGDSMAERMIDSLVGLDRGRAMSEYVRWQVEQVARLAGLEDVDAGSPIDRARLLPLAKQMAAQATAQSEMQGVQVAKYTEPSAVNTVLLEDGDMVWADGEWHAVARFEEGRVTELRDGYTRVYETGEDAVVQGVLRKGDDGYAQALEEYRQQEVEKGAQLEMDGVAPDEVVPDVEGIDPVNSPTLSLESQTPAEMDAERARIAAQQQAQAQRDEIARRAAKPITGNAGDVAPAAGPSATGARAMADVGAGPAAGGAAEGANEIAPAQNRNYSMLPLELPELVDMARRGLGSFPKLKQALRALDGSALGVFRGGKLETSIELRRDLFGRVTTPEDVARIRAEASAWAAENWREREGGPSREEAEAGWARERLGELRDRRLKENPKLASSVLAHEIGHWIDFVPQGDMSRGNILGHVAALHRYTKQMLAGVPPNNEAALPSTKERAALRRHAERMAGKRPKEEAKLKEWRAWVKERYGEMVEKKARKRGLVTRKQIAEELGPLIAWWHGTETIPEYFTAPEEMYADAFSVLANNPAAVRQRAPAYYKLWSDWLSQRPEARDLWQRYQTDATLGRVGDERDRRQMAGIAEADRAHERQLRAKLIMSPRQNADALAAMLFSSAYPLERRAKAAAKAGRADTAERMRKALQDERYSHAWAHGYLLEVQDKVGRTVFGEAGVPMEEWQAFLQNRQIAENRQGIASMGGMNPAASAEALARQRQRLGAAAYGAMERAQELWHELRRKYVIQLAMDKGLVDAELANLMEQRAAYSHVAAVDTDIDPVSAVFQQSYGPEVGSKIHKQEGFLGLARDPWQATLELDRNLIAAAYRNELKAAASAMLADAGEELYRPAGTRWDAGLQRQVPVTGESPRASTVVFMRGGKPESYWAPQEVADFIDNADPVSARVLTGLINTLLRKQKGVFTWLNYGFPLFNTPRDIQDWIRNLPGWKGRVTYNRYAAKAKPIVDSILAGKPNEEAAGVLRSNILLYFPEGLNPGQDRLTEIVGDRVGGRVGRALQSVGPQTALERMTAAYGLRPEWMGLDVTGRAKMLAALKEVYMRPTQRGEMMRKVAAWIYLSERYPDLTDQERQRMVQEYGGSPDFANRARKNPVIDALFPFYNPFLRGWQSSAKAFAEEPVRVALTAMRYGMMPKLIMAGIASGVLTEALKRLFGDWGEKVGEEYRKMALHIPQYYKDNYAVHPLWWDPTDPTRTKVIFETSPLSESNRFASGALWTLLDGKDAAGLLDFGAEQLPGINPILTLSAQWGQVLTGRAPSGLGITQTQVDAGAAVSPMMRETWNQMSGGMLGRIPREGLSDVGLSRLEKILRLPVISNTLGRRIRISNKGWAEGLKAAAEPIERARAEVRTQAWKDAYDHADTGKFSDEALARRMRGAMVMAERPSGTPPEAYMAILPRDAGLDAYYSERLNDYMLEAEMAKQSPRLRAIRNKPWTQRVELIKGYGD